MTDRTVSSAPARRPRRELSEGQLAAVLLAPALLVLGAVLLYPMLSTLYTSLLTQKLTEPWLGTPFSGLKNYVQLVHDARFWTALQHTLVFGVLTVSGSFLVGVPMALIAHWEGRLRPYARVAMLLPWAMPPTFTALTFQWMFNGQYGVVNDLLVRLGGEARSWLTQPVWAATALILTIIWKTSSFVALMVLGGLQGVPRELTEAAEVDGAGSWVSFWRVTVPLLAPTLAVAFIFRAISALQVFDIPYAFSGGGPAGATETLGIYIYRTSIEFLDFGYGAALAVALFAVSLGITAVYVRYVRGDQ
ncbi:sugar ABC transporter permease [Deinococcus sonorensis]|uniref:Sugar ABC transporter permease n=2 Tax=Deinococcus sonorensis TaxID=309891 RepID=A0AAU7UHI5_9DEIO